MAQVNAGRVRFVGRGEYNNSTQYYVFDLVSYNGNSYYAKADTIGNLPTDTTYWQLVAEKGNVGPTGLTGNGISSITKTGTSGLVDTYTITFTNGNTTTFDVTNGNGIDRIEKTATVGNIDTYTIYFNDNSTSTFEVANGEVTREELEEEVDRLSMIYNAFPTTSDEDEQMSLDGTAEVPFKKLNLKGNTSQFSTTGKNLMPNTMTNTSDAGVTFTKNSDGTISLSGTASASTYVIICDNITINGQVTLSSGVGRSNNYYLRALDRNNNYARLLSTRESGDSQTPTATINTKIQVVLNINSGANCNGIVIKPMLELGSSATSYEPYTGGNPAPNPDYPQDIQVVSGDNTIKVEGKNLLNVNNIYSSTSTTNLQRSYENGIATLTWSSGFNFYMTQDNSQTTPLNILDSSKTYTISFYHKGNALNLRFDESDNNIVTTANDSDYTKYSYTFTGLSELVIKFVRSDNTGTAYLKDFQIEYGSTATTYEPYQSASYPINLGNIELCKIGDYQDYIRKSTGKNLLNISDITSGNGITNNGDGTITLNGTITNTSFTLTNPITLKANKTYTLSLTNTYSNGSNSTFILRNGSTNIMTVYFKNKSSNAPFTPTQDTVIDTLRIFGDDVNFSNYTFSIQLEENNQYTSYEPYGKVWCLNKQIGKVVLDGNENWFTQKSTSPYVFALDYDNYKRTQENICKCNLFLSVTNSGYGNLTDGQICFRYNSGDTNKHLYVCTTVASTVNDFKTWLSIHNTEVDYALATPTDTQITDTTLIEQLDNLENAYSYDTQTNITQTNDDMPFILDVEAILSLKNIFN